MENDRLIDIDEAAELLCTSRDFLYHNWQKEPYKSFAKKISPRQLRFKLQGIQRYIASNQEESGNGNV